MRRILTATFMVVAATMAHAQKFQQEFGNARKPFVEIIAVPNHPDNRYALGQQATLRIIAREGGKPAQGLYIYYKVGDEMFLPAQYDSIPFIEGEAQVNMGTRLEPGFRACQYEFKLSGKRYADLVKVAFAPEQIRPFTKMPQDFEKFWQKTLKEARKVDLQPEYQDIQEATNENMKTQLVKLHVGKDKWIYGYLTRPTDGRKHPVVLVPPGAGSQKIFPSDYFTKQGFVYLKIEIHGNNPTMDDESYNAMRHEKCDGYMRKGMESAESYYYKDVYAGCARAVDFLCSLPEWDGKNVIVTGGSQGGALTIVTAALNEKVTLCAPFYPALCDLEGFLHQRAGGWPKFFTSYYADGEVDIPFDKATKTLSYFDVVNFARLLKTPIFCSWGYSDDTCSPTSIWAMYNEISAPKTCDITPISAHWRFAETQEKCLKWMMERLDLQP